MMSFGESQAGLRAMAYHLTDNLAPGRTRARNLRQKKSRYRVEPRNGFSWWLWASSIASIHASPFCERQLRSRP